MRVFETEDGVENDKANEPEGLTRILGHNTPLILVPSEDLNIFFAYYTPL